MKNMQNVGSTLLRLLLFVPLVLLCTTCDTSPRSAHGFRLPDGDIDKGRAEFVTLNCHACHTVSGEELPAPAAAKEYQVALGGEVLRVKTYGELVTAIINPSEHIRAEFRDNISGEISPMPADNASMSVQQLTDLVAFLQAHYIKVQPKFETYPYTQGVYPR